jgi:hypothetical protein
MSDFYIRKFDYPIYYINQGFCPRGKLKGIAIFRHYWYGQNVTKIYAPTNNKKALQQSWRWNMYNAVYNWHHFDSPTKNFYNQDAKRKVMTGFNRWISLYIKAQGEPMIYQAFPINSVFISIVATDPSALLGYGTWSAFGAGCVLIGLDAGDPDFDTVLKTGGVKTVVSSVQDHADHKHNVITNVAVAQHAAKNTDAAGVGASNVGTSASTLTLKAHVHNITLYTHTVTNNQVTTLAPLGVMTHTGNATSVVQPYIVVYFWKRTA